MALSIEYTREAEEKLLALFDFIENKFSHTSALQALDAIESRLNQLKSLPLTGTEEHLAGAMPNRKVIVNENTIIRYRIDGSSIRILDIFDARSDWKK